MATIVCRTCGDQYLIDEGTELRACPSCGTVNSRPRAVGSGLERLNRAVHQRAACDFHAAERSYQYVLLDYPDEHEALWGLALCRYGVEYVEDRGQRLPTVHFLRRKPMSEDADVIRACALAPAEVAAQYRRDAAYVDEIIGRLTGGTPPLRTDVFICHKATVPESGGWTQDFERARSLYIALLKRGYEPFFAHDSLQDAVGANYEAAIYHALTTSKVMLVICSKAEWLNSPWVRSEWTRFLERVDDGQACCLIPLLYDGMKPELLPEPFVRRRLEGLRMDEVDAFEGLQRALVKHGCGKASVMSSSYVPAPAKPVVITDPPRPKPVRVRKDVPGILRLQRMAQAAGRLAKMIVYLDDEAVATMRDGETIDIPVKRDAELSLRFKALGITTNKTEQSVHVRAGYRTEALSSLHVKGQYQRLVCEILSETPIE